MTRFTGFLSLLAGIAVLTGYFVPTLGSDFYLVLIGGILAVVAGLLSFRRPMYGGY